MVFFLAMAAVAAHGSKINNINYNNNIQHIPIINNNIYNTIITLFNNSTKNLNTLLSTTLKAVTLLPPTFSTQTNPPLPVPARPVPLPPCPKGIMWRTVYFRSSRLLIPSISCFYNDPTQIYKNKKTPPPPLPPTKKSTISCG